jgi:hypothetical protein
MTRLERIVDTYKGNVFNTEHRWRSRTFEAVSGILLSKTTNYVALPAMMESGNYTILDEQAHTTERILSRHDVKAVVYYEFDHRNVLFTQDEERIIISNYTAFFKIGAMPSFSPLFVLVFDRGSNYYDRFLMCRDLESMQKGAEFWINSEVGKRMRGKSATLLYKVGIPLAQHHGFRIVAKPSVEIMRELSPLRMPKFSTITEFKETKRNIVKEALV